MPVKINIVQASVEARIKGAINKTLWALSSEIRADCNEYCKEDSGALIASSMLHSRLSEGKIIWQTPYAKRQYWEIKTSLTPGRTWKWCEAAKRMHLSRWERLAQKGFNENL